MNFIQSLKESIGGYYRNLVSSYVRRLHSHLTVLEGRVSGLYAHLESRGVPMPTDESGNPLPKDTLHLLPTLRHLDSRRIESCTNEIADGTSLAELAVVGSNATSLVDTAQGWSAPIANVVRLRSLFPSLAILSLGCKELTATTTVDGIGGLTELHLPNLEYFGNDQSVWSSYFRCTLLSGSNVTSVVLPSLKHIRFAQYNGMSDRSAMFNGCSKLEEIVAPMLDTTTASHDAQACSCIANNCKALRRIVIGGKILGTGTGGYSGGLLSNCPNIEVIEVKSLFGNSASAYNMLKGNSWSKLRIIDLADGQRVSMDMSNWSPTIDSSNLSEFQSNFHRYIAERLADMTGKTAPTLTLSQSVRDNILPESEQLIIDKHWALAPAKSV